MNCKEDLITSLIESMIFVNLFFKIFTTKTQADTSFSRFIELSDSQIEPVINRIIEIQDIFKTSKVIKLNQDKSEKFYWYKYTRFLFSLLNEINS